jgi:hypothetical protein
VASAAEGPPARPPGCGLTREPPSYHLRSETSKDDLWITDRERAKRERLLATEFAETYAALSPDDVTPDGQRFLLILAGAAASPDDVIVDWTRLLR